MILRTLQLARGHVPELSGDSRVALGKTRHRAALDHQDFAIDDGLGGEGMHLPNFESEKIARQIEGADLAPAIVEHLVGPHAAAEHLVQIFGFFVLSVDFGIARKRHGRAHDVDLTG